MPNWTDNQKQAINATGGSVIVSAAAGAGKTAVLVERVISRITDPTDPVDIDRILIVTYTRAAAAELKERLSSRLTRLIYENPTDKNLIRQQLLLSKAHISTIDGYCSSVVKEFFYMLDIDVNLRIADDGELGIIKRDALKLTLDSMYLSAEPDFFRLVESFSNSKDDTKLQDNILRIHTFLRSHPFMDKWISSKLDMFTSFGDVSDSVWGKIITDYSHQAVSYITSLCDSSLNIISHDEKLEQKFKPVIQSDLYLAQSISQALDGGTWTDVSHVLESAHFDALYAPKGYKDNPYKLKAAANRDEFKSIVSSLKNLYSYDPITCQKDVSHLCVLSQQLLYCVQIFSQNYQMLKSAKKVADYSDLEHWTLQLLINEHDMTHTDIARQIKTRFDEIMVDEYQDANEVQDYIFNAISNGSNLFFVGDVKQSIYGFRQAMPQMFLQRKNSSHLYCEHNPMFPAKIILDKNFRSAKGITQAVNYFFAKLMSVSVGEICYDESESLSCGADYKICDSPCVEICMLDMDSIDEPDANVAEAKYIAQTITRMIGEHYMVKDGESYRNAQYGDFSILMRSAAKYAPIYVDTLIKCGIPAYCESTYSFLDSQEIKVMTSMLSVIDNPCLDIELLTVMMSPMFGFTPDDLAVIRSDSRTGNLYKSVKLAADNGSKKCINLISELKYYRDISTTLTVSSLINAIYERTSYELIVSALSDNKLALNNLRLFREYASNYEKGSNPGLSRFVSYLHRLADTKSDLSSSADTDTSAHNAVCVMSIHKSKGLEFPVCFIANTAKKINSDKSNNVILHSKYGMAVKRLDKSLDAWYNTMPREALSLEVDREEKSEELRVLYVAMTRAKQKLFILSAHNKLDRYLARISTKLVDSKVISPFVVRGATMFCDWAVMCALLHPDCEALRNYCDADIECDSDVDFAMSSHIITSLSVAMYASDDVNSQIDACDIDQELIDILHHRTSYMYKKSSLLKLPSKIAASQLSHKLSDSEFDKMLDTPAFVNNKKLTPAQRGTALHAFMQFCDFEAARSDIESEILRLTKEGFISVLQADSIDRKKAFDFVNSDIITRCINSECVFKEYRFTIKIDASLVDDSVSQDYKDEKILLQGAVDLAFVEDNQLVIVDYKTDNVKQANDLYDMYNNQLKIYASAMQQCTDYKVKESIIYSVKHNQSIVV